MGNPWARPDPSHRASPWGWLLVALLAVFAVAPLTYPGFFQAHSGFLPAFNASHLSEAPHWGRVADPLRGEGQLPYLLVRPFWWLSGSGLVAVKWGYALAWLLGAVGTYAWTRPWLGPKGGVLSAVVYTYLPWHLSTVYVRGAYAEAWLWAVLPFTLWAVDQLARQRFLAALLIGLPSLAAAIWTQPGLAALHLLLLAAYNLAVTRRGHHPLLRLAGTIALVLVMSILLLAWPLRQAPRPFADHLLYPFQLLSASWGYGISVPGWADGLPFQLGLVAVGLSAIALVLWLGARSGRLEATGDSAPSLGRPLCFSLATLLALTLLTLTPSAFLWRIIHLDALLTYPWQLLLLSGPPLAFLAGSPLRLDGRLAERPAWAALLALTILASYAYLAPRFSRLDPGPEPLAMFQPAGAAEPPIHLLAYQIVPPTEITPTLALTLTWQAVQPLTDDLTVFVHVLAPDGSRVAQRDSFPCAGDCPTSTWLPGEILADPYQLPLPPGTYRLAVGLYLLGTGDRAAVAGRDDGTVFLDVP